jgi:hypothetical protein
MPKMQAVTLRTGYAGSTDVHSGATWRGEEPPLWFQDRYEFEKFQN